MRDIHAQACNIIFANRLHDAAPPRRLKILLVENHEDTLIYLTMYLERQGHDVLGVRDTSSAPKATSTFHSDVLISDIMLPDGDGWQLLRQMERKPFGIAMSGLQPHRITKKLRGGHKYHLDSPFLPDDLDALLEKAALQIPTGLTLRPRL